MEVGTVLLQAICSVGFPIVMCLIFFWYINEQRKDYTAQITAINTEHKEEVQKLVAEFSQAIKENTQAINDLRQVLRERGAKEEYD